MATLAPERLSAPSADPVTAGRIRLLAVVMVLAAMPGLVLMVLWNGPDEANHLYTYTELAPDRDQWWAILMSVGLLLALTVPLQGLLTMSLVRARGSSWATAGGVLMWLGAICQTSGLAGWANAYLFPTDPGITESAGRAVFEAANSDEFRLYGLVPIGMGLVVLGTILQSVGLLRARTVPTWVPIVALSVILGFLIPGFGVVSLVASVPMFVATAAIGHYAVRAVRG